MGGWIYSGLTGSRDLHTSHSWQGRHGDYLSKAEQKAMREMYGLLAEGRRAVTAH